MKERHIHADLIIAWAEGAQIQRYLELKGGWEDVNRPLWSTNTTYRIKPREFEDSAYYPVTTIIKPSMTNPPDLTLYREGYFYMAGEDYAYSESDFNWIGEKLSVDWPKESE